MPQIARIVIGGINSGQWRQAFDGVRFDNKIGNDRFASERDAPVCPRKSCTVDTVGEFQIQQFQ
jgi:hypothetical protein